MTLPDYEVRPLIGARILVIEDEAILALDLALTIADVGAAVEGPIHRMDQAMSLSDLQTLDAAVLDVDINGTEVFPFADRLWSTGVPLVFHTGRTDITHLRANYPGSEIVRKPSPAREIVGRLARAMRHASMSNASEIAAS